MSSHPLDQSRQGAPKMPRHAHFVPHGVIPAVLLPFHDDLSIDEAELPQASARRGGDRGHLGHHHQRPFDRGRVLHASTSSGACSTSPRTRSATGCRSSTASGPTAASRPRASPAWRPRAAPRRCWCSRRRRSRCGQIAGDGGRALQAHRRRQRPADHRVPVSARDRPGLSARHAAEDGRGRCRRSAPSRTGPATCRSTRCTSARCRTCRGR